MLVCFYKNIGGMLYKRWWPGRPVRPHSAMGPQDAESPSSPPTQSWLMFLRKTSGGNMSLSKPKTYKNGKLSGLRISDRQKFANDAHDIQTLFVERLPNHTLREVCLYIAGHFHNKLRAKDQRIKELQEELEQFKNVSRETSSGGSDGL